MQPYRQLNWADVNTASSQALAYEAAVKGITLLKNDGTLPFSTAKPLRVALIGDWANATGQLQGNYQGKPHNVFQVKDLTDFWKEPHLTSSHLFKLSALNLVSLSTLQLVSLVLPAPMSLIWPA